MGSLQSIYLLERETCVINHYSEFTAEAVHCMNTKANQCCLGIFFINQSLIYIQITVKKTYGAYFIPFDLTGILVHW